MNKELEEAIKYLKLIRRNHDLEKKGYVYTEEAIEIVLKYIENSIPKEVIEEVINKKYTMIFEGNTDFPDEATEMKRVKYIKADYIQELLEGK